ncbi:MFS transporter [Streptomyces lydicus]
MSGPLADRYGSRTLLAAGGVLSGLGLFLTAHASALWQAYLAYGLGTGLGVGCVYVPVMTAVGSWFDRRRALATGIVVSGVGLGTVVSSPLSAWMVHAFGWRRSYEYYAVGGVVLLLLCAALVPRPPRHEPMPTAAPETGRGRRGFGTRYLSEPLINIVIYVPFVRLPQYARHHGVSGVAAASLVSVIGVSSIIGLPAVELVGVAPGAHVGGEFSATHRKRPMRMHDNASGVRRRIPGTVNHTKVPGVTADSSPATAGAHRTAGDG